MRVNMYHGPDEGKLAGAGELFRGAVKQEKAVFVRLKIVGDDGEPGFAMIKAMLTSVGVTEAGEMVLGLEETN